MMAPLRYSASLSFLAFGLLPGFILAGCSVKTGMTRREERAIAANFKDVADIVSVQLEWMGRVDWRLKKLEVRAGLASFEDELEVIAEEVARDVDKKLCADKKNAEFCKVAK